MGVSSVKNGPVFWLTVYEKSVDYVEIKGIIIEASAVFCLIH